MNATAAHEELTFEAIVPMTREALLDRIMRRVGAWGKPYRLGGQIGPVAAWKTDAGFELRRTSVFGRLVWIVLAAEVEDRGASCRIHGRVGWDPKLQGERRFAWFVTLGMGGWGVFWLYSGGVPALLHPMSILVMLILLVLPSVALYREFYAPDVRRSAPEHRRFLIEWLERLIDAPVTVRSVRTAP